MRLRVHRRHESGASNADRRDEKTHKLNASEMISRRQLNNSFHTTSNAIQSRDQIQQTRYVNEQLQNALMKSKPLYDYCNKDIKARTGISLPRTGHLEETQKGKRVFVGDSLVYLDNPHTQQDFKINPIDQSHLLSSQIYGSNKKEYDDNNLSKEVKHEDNKGAKLETQLVELRENKDTAEGQFNSSKVNEIKQAIQRKYHHRTNFKAIFQAWDEEGKGYINSSNISNMLNRMGIKCNQEEAQILLSTADKDNSNNLNMQKFLDLIFVNNNINSTNNQRQTKDFRSYSTNQERKTNGINLIDTNTNFNSNKNNEEISSPELQKKYRQQIQDSNENRSEKRLNLVLKNKISQLLNNFWIYDHKQSGNINQKTLNDIIRRKVDLSNSVVTDQEIEQLFKKYQKSNGDSFDYKSFVKDISSFTYEKQPQNSSEIINESMRQTKQFQNQMKKFKHENPTEFNVKDVIINDIQHDNPSHIDWMKTRADKLSKHIQKFFNSQKEFSQYLKQQIQDQNKDQIHKNDLLKTFKNMFDTSELRFEKRDYEGIMEMFQYNKHGYTNTEDIPQIVYQEDSKQLYTRIGQRIRGPPPLIVNGKNSESNNFDINKAATAQSMYLNKVENSQYGLNDQSELKKQSATINVQVINQDKRQPTNQSRDKRGQSLDSCQSIQYDGYETQYTKGQIKNVLKKVEDKLFLGDSRAYDVFKQFDLDKDGYVKKDELNQKLSQMSLLDPSEQKIFNAYVDPSNQGYLNFSQFNKKLYSNMSTQFERNEYDINPSNQKQIVQNRINMSKTYTNFISDSKSQQNPYQPQRSRITQSYLNNYNSTNSDSMIKPLSNTGQYASEHDRFSRNKLDFQQEDKQRKEKYHFNRLQNMRINQNIIEQRRQLADIQIDQKTQATLNQRAAVKQVYENVVKSNPLTATAF